MQLGRHLHELSRHRLGLLVSVLLASLAALWSVGKVSVDPPGIKPRVLQMGAASTRALVDSPKSAVLDLQVPTGNLQAMTNRGVLVGNMIASAPVRAYIARRAHVRPELLQVSSPVTPDFPRPLASSGKRSTSDIVDSPNAYRLSVQSNPTVPIVDIYAEAPTAAAARALANGAVEGMQDYLGDLAVTQAIPERQRVHLVQLGGATGGVINPGVSVKLGLLSFFIVFGASSLAVMAVSRVRRGWGLAAARRGPAEGTA
jgi:hypothetical protein